MMNRLVRSSNITRKSTAQLMAAVLTMQVMLPGCGIPPLRTADPGPALPPSFEAANNLNYYNQPQTPPTEPPAEPMTDPNLMPDPMTDPSSATPSVTRTTAKPTASGKFVQLTSASFTEDSETEEALRRDALEALNASKRAVSGKAAPPESAADSADKRSAKSTDSRVAKLLKPSQWMSGDDPDTYADRHLESMGQTQTATWVALDEAPATDESRASLAGYSQSANWVSLDEPADSRVQIASLERAEVLTAEEGAADLAPKGIPLQPLAAGMTNLQQLPDIGSQSDNASPDLNNDNGNALPLFPVPDLPADNSTDTNDSGLPPYSDPFPANNNMNTMGSMPPAPGDPADGINATPTQATNLHNTSYMPFYDFFQDPYLGSLIQQALSGNQELKILTQEIRIAQLEVYGRSGEYLPFVTAGAGAGIDKPGRYTRDGAVEDQLDIRPGHGFPEPLPDFLVAANLSWELDIWRKLRNARDAAALRYLGTQDGQTYIVTRLVAEIADNYFELLSLDNQMSILNRTIKNQQNSLELSKQKLQFAAGNSLAVYRFQAEVAKNQSRLSIIQQQIIESENRINFLLGRYPQHIDRDPSNYIDLQLNALKSGVPVELLRNRADVREAERQLEAAGLDVKVARARFYPSLHLNAGVGYEAFNPRYLFNTPESLIYNVAADLMAPLINKRAIRADYLSANASQLQACYNYQRTVLNAFTEVINRLAKVENYRQSIEIKKVQLKALEDSVTSATDLFINARAEYVDVLLAQRDLNEARVNLVETKQEQLSAMVNAYQALGGGGIVLPAP